MSDAQVLKASQDIVRAVVAHEVGHTLGLRHNFAGSLAKNIEPAEMDKAFTAYLNGKPMLGKVTSSTVMDYVEFRDQLLMGDLLLRNKDALPYDQMAIATLYKGKTFAKDEVPAFCTDRSKGKFVDCDVFDSGSSVVQQGAQAVSVKAETAAHMVLEVYTALTKTPSRGQDITEIERISLDPQKLARWILGERHALYRTLTDQSAILAVRRNFPYVSPINEEEVKEAEMQWLTMEFAKVGGLAKAFAPLPQDYAEKAYVAFLQLLSNKRYLAGNDRDNKPWAYTQEEIVRLKKAGKLLFDKLKPALVIEDVLILMGAATPKAKLADSDLSRDLAVELEKRAAEYILAVDPGKELVIVLEPNVSKVLSGAAPMGIDGIPGLPIGKGDAKAVAKPAGPKTLTLPTYAYPPEVRMAAARLLSSARAEAPEWGLSERARLRAKVQTALSAAVAGKDLNSIKIEGMPRQLARWLLENNSVGAAVGQ